VAGTLLLAGHIDVVLDRLARAEAELAELHRGTVRLGSFP
jgi:hypothetical protein